MRRPAHYPVVAGQQEAQMRKAVSIVIMAALVSVFLDALLGPDETIALSET
jgi:hypothetical protein